MNEQNDFASLYEKICHEWNKAEEDVKRAEQVCDEVIIPSIKELRYAGRRLVQALELNARNGDKAEIEKLLNDAAFDCHRARHDAIDASTAQIAKVMRIATEKLKYGAILTAFPDFPRLWERLNAIRGKIVASRGSAQDRDRLYETVEAADFPALLSLYAQFQAREGLMQDIARTERRKATAKTVITICSLVVAVASLVVSAVGHHALVVAWRSLFG